MLRLQVTVSRGSPKRQQLLEKRGTFQVLKGCCCCTLQRCAWNHGKQVVGMAPPLWASCCTHTIGANSYLAVFVAACRQVPYLEDPNEGVYLFESSAIIDYLERTYALGSSGGGMLAPVAEVAPATAASSIVGSG